MSLHRKKLIVVRHGNTFNSGDVLLRVGKRTDLDLVETKKGTLAGQYIEKQGFNVTRVFAGPLKRQIQTAELISDVLEFNRADIVIDQRFDELDYAEHDGKPEEQVVAELGEEVLKLWDQSAIPPKEWLVDVDAIKQAWQSFIDEVATYTDGEDTVVVTSNGTLRFLPALIKTHDANLTLKVPTGGVVVLEQQENGDWQIVEWGVKPEKVL